MKEDIRYFIERTDGMWMVSPDEEGASWTRDPSKAWAFDKPELLEECYVNYTGYGGNASRESAEVLWWMEEEGIEGFRITEHEFLGEAKIFRNKNWMGGETIVVYHPAW